MAGKDVKDFVRELRALGFERVPSGKHIKMYDAKNNVTVMIPNTPSDWRSMRNARAQFRRTIRGLLNNKKK